MFPELLYGNFFVPQSHLKSVNGYLAKIVEVDVLKKIKLRRKLLEQLNITFNSANTFSFIFPFK